jgi:hypothetical protein
MNLLLSPLFCSFFLLTGWSATAVTNAVAPDDSLAATQALSDGIPAERVSVPDAAPHNEYRPGGEASRNSRPHVSGSSPVAAFGIFSVPFAETSILRHTSEVDSLGAAKTSHFGRLSARKI